MRHRHTISRGDLLRCLLRCPGADEAVAAMCGYRAAAPEEPVAPAAATVEARVTPSVREGAPPVAVSMPTPPAVNAARCEFLMPLRFTLHGEPPPPPPGTDWLTEEGISQAELSATRTMPAPPPLVPWSRLWPFLHRVLGCRRPGRRVDVRCLVRRLARLQPVRDVPRTPVLAWAPEAWVLVDDRPELTPFRADFADLVQRLQRQRGRTGLRCERVDNQTLARGQARCFWTGRARLLEAPAGAPVLVLSDLGCLPRQADLREPWRQFGAGLTQRGIRATVLMPCPASRWDRALARSWNCVCWDRQERLRPRSGRPFPPPVVTSQEEATRVEQLLDVLAPAIRIEPALLRGARLLLAAHQADVGTEFDAWHHKEAAFTADAMALRPAATLRRRVAFARLDDQLKLAVAQLLRDVHRHWSVTFFARETLTLRECGTPLPDAHIEQARGILRRINKTMFEIVLDDPGRARILRVFEWQQADFARCTSAARGTPESAVAWALARTWRGEEICSIPEEIDREEVARTQARLLAGGGPAVWQVGWAGDELVLARGSADPSIRSPVGSLPAVAPRFDVALLREDGGGELLNAIPRPTPAHVRIPLSKVRHVAVRSDRAELDFEMVPPPPWATRFGWDRCGLFADFEVGGVTFPLRWIPPGEFDMGSPEDEPGRWKDESPQHRVTVGHGFWLGETPVTQGQYAAVTGQRPAMFRHATDQAPVEQVNWDDCREFCEQLKKRVADLDRDSAFRLPTEAEWEYACRAGTAGALYTGPLTILGENNGPELDAIAWYGGNSGVDYEGGYDSSGWKDKQYDHKRAGTHPVRQKAPNAWGLYDMLGNVWEWCEDDWHENYKGAPTDGSAWKGEGARRVYRGGGWACHARFCRCAYRGRWEPGDRDVSLGFRLVLAVMVKEGIRPFS